MDIVALGRNIRALRREKGLTLEQLAEILGIKKNMLSNYELGKNSISAELLSRIADYFAVSLDSITGRSNHALRENTSGIAMRVIPVFARVYSDDFDRQENKMEFLYSFSIPDVYFDANEYFGLKITDDRLNLRAFQRGSIAVCTLQSYAYDGDMVVYTEGESPASYGIYSKTDKNVIILPSSTNPEYKPLIFAEGASFKIIGKITMIFGSTENKSLLK